MATRKHQRNDRRLLWGDGYIEPRETTTGEPRYMARWREVNAKGKRIWRGKTFPDKGDAELHLQSIAKRKATGRYLPQSDIKVGEMVQGWIERSYNLSDATTLTYGYRLKGQIIPELGNRRAIDLTPAGVQRWIDTLKARGLAGSTIEQCVLVLRGAYKDAVRLQIVPTNPVTGVKIPARKHKEMAVWNAEEARLIIEKLADDPMWRTVYLIALTTGMRPGELMALSWRDIDIPNLTIAIRRTLTKPKPGDTIIGKTTKTGRERSIAIAPMVADALTTWRQEQRILRVAAESWAEPNLVFTREDGRRLNHGIWFYRNRQLIKEHGLPLITLHGLRHTSATLELNAGTHPKIVSERLGHQSIQTTIDIYMHLSVDLQRIAAKALEEQLLGSPVTAGDPPPITVNSEKTDQITPEVA